jgi:heme/copper-type cytochrome/quinol oxidase subunit 2
VLRVGFALTVIFTPLSVNAAEPVERTIHLDASRFSYNPSVLRVNPGDRVTIELEAHDVVHGLSIDGYEVQMTAEPGQTTRLTFTASRSGTFRFRCTVTCGNMHPFMIGKFQVGPNLLYARASALAVLAVIAGVLKLRT